MTLTTPYGCPRCKATLGYIENEKLHVEINGRTFTLNGVITLTCAHPCNHQWKFRLTANGNEQPARLATQVA